ncbi:MAG: sigma 54-interacting transcriptional regulator [Bdellovibrionota bacterium]
MSDSRPNGLFDFDPGAYPNSPSSGVATNNYTNSLPSESENRISEEEMLRHYPTRDEKVFKLLEVARTIAPTKVPVLITGESGTGKETFAKSIHIAGGRDRGRFVVASCSSIPPNFFEMEIFNTQKNPHDFNQMNSGRIHETCSLMLDEITELDASMQLKLLRVLKEQDINKGAIRKGTASDARIIACSNRNLQDEVNAQRFRNDLFFKLHVIHLEIPPLRIRPVDIDFYSEICLREFNLQFSKNVQLSPTAKQALRTYTWPGNIRELRNVVQRSVLLATRDYIGVEDLHLIRTNSRTEVAMGDPLPQVTLRELEQRLILQTLRRMNGNRTHTAKALGISLRALRYKLNELVECGYEVEGKNA